MAEAEAAPSLAPPAADGDPGPGSGPKADFQPDSGADAAPESLPGAPSPGLPSDETASRPGPPPAGGAADGAAGECGLAGGAAAPLDADDDEDEEDEEEGEDTVGALPGAGGGPDDELDDLDDLSFLADDIAAMQMQMDVDSDDEEDPARSRLDTGGSTEDEDDEDDEAERVARATRSVRRSFVVVNELGGDAGAQLTRGRGFTPGAAARACVPDETRWEWKMQLLRTEEGWQAERLRALLALVLSEAAYVEQLEALLSCHVEQVELEGARGLSASLYALRDVHVVHTSLLAMLRTLVPGGGPGAHIADSLALHAPLFVCYGPLLVRLGRLSEVLTARDDGDELEGGSPWARFMSVADLLALPRERLRVYRELLVQVRRRTPEAHADEEALGSLLATLAEVQAQVGEHVRRHERQQQMLRVQGEFGASAQLLRPGRQFVRSGRMVLLDPKQRRAQRRLKRFAFHLFSDLLVVSDERSGGCFAAVHQLPLAGSDAGPVAKPGAYSGLVFEGCALLPEAAMMFKSRALSFVAFAADAGERDAWLTQLDEHIAEATDAAAGALGTMATSAKARRSAAAPLWDPDSSTDHCRYCSRNFTMLMRRHHCRRCGNVVCGPCSRHSVLLPEINTRSRVRVCDPCMLKLETLQYKASAGRSKVATMWKDGATKCGWLLFRPTGSKKWARRWCTLLGEARIMLLYESDESDQPVNRALLRGAALQSARAKKHALELRHPEQRPMLFAMQSADEKADWLAALSAAAADEEGAAAAAAAEEEEQPQQPEFTEHTAAATLGLDMADAREAAIARFVSRERAYLRDLRSIADVYGSHVMAMVREGEGDLDDEPAAASPRATSRAMRRGTGAANDDDDEEARRRAAAAAHADPARRGALALLHSVRMLHLVTSELAHRLEREPHGIGRALCEVAPLFRLYAVFLAQYESAVTWLRSPRGLIFVKRCGDASPGPLLALLSAVRTRVPLLMAQLSQLLQATPEGHPDARNITEAVQRVSEASDFVGGMRARTAARARLLAVRAAFVGSVPFGQRGQGLLREGPLSAVGRFGRRRRTVFLFTDGVAVAKVGAMRAHTYKLQSVLPLQGLEVEAVAGEPAQLSIDGTVFAAADEGDRDEWLAALCDAKQALAAARAGGRQRGPVQVHGFDGSEAFEPRWAVVDAGELQLFHAPDGPVVGAVALTAPGDVRAMTLLKISLPGGVTVQLDNPVEARDWLAALQAAALAAAEAVAASLRDSECSASDSMSTTWSSSSMRLSAS